MKPRILPLSTGQHSCYNSDGKIIPCKNSGQDGESAKGIPWPDPRFKSNGETTQDLLTGLIWTTDSSPAEFPLPWKESFDFISTMNENNFAGRNDWRMPNRRELHSLISFGYRKPALPDHPFGSIFLGWYWSSTTYAGLPDHAWRVHTEGGRMFFGHKSEDSLLWPVAGQSSILPATGQRVLYDHAGRDAQKGEPLPDLRFKVNDQTVTDLLTGLTWLRKADLCGPVSWEQALKEVQNFNNRQGTTHWRLPTIRELESLVDASSAYPALTASHPFTNLGDSYWSSTSSSFEYNGAMALYLNKGAIGVGFKSGEPFLVWPVCEQ